jgi:hypothetical protein
MARIIYQEQDYIVPDGEIQGGELIEALKVPPGHNLVVIQPDGNRVVHRHDKVRPVDGDYFLDAPTFEYGAPKV